MKTRKEHPCRSKSSLNPKPLDQGYYGTWTARDDLWKINEAELQTGAPATSNKDEKQIGQHG